MYSPIFMLVLRRSLALDHQYVRCVRVCPLFVYNLRNLRKGDGRCLSKWKNGVALTRCKSKVLPTFLQRVNLRSTS